MCCLKSCFLTFCSLHIRNDERERERLIGAHNSLGVTQVLANFSVSIVCVFHRSAILQAAELSVNTIYIQCQIHLALIHRRKVARGREEKECAMGIEMKWKCFTPLTLGNSVLITVAGEEELSQLQLGVIQNCFNKFMKPSETVAQQKQQEPKYLATKWNEMLNQNNKGLHIQRQN